MKYTIPHNWRETCDGMGCCCGARDESECCHCGPCSGADWTTRETYELRIEVNALHAEIGRMRVAIGDTFKYLRTIEKKPIDAAASPVA